MKRRINPELKASLRDLLDTEILCFARNQWQAHPTVGATHLDRHLLGRDTHYCRMLCPWGMVRFCHNSSDFPNPRYMDPQCKQICGRVNSQLPLSTGYVRETPIEGLAHDDDFRVRLDLPPDEDLALMEPDF